MENKANWESVFRKLTLNTFYSSSILWNIWRPNNHFHPVTRVRFFSQVFVIFSRNVFLFSMWQVLVRWLLFLGIKIGQRMKWCPLLPSTGGGFRSRGSLGRFRGSRQREIPQLLGQLRENNLKHEKIESKLCSFHKHF